MAKRRVARKGPAIAGPVKIEKGIPIPETRGRGCRSIYPWDELSVGDSFLLNKGSRQNSHSVTSYQSGKRSPKKFIYRKTADGYRVWRTA